MISRILALLSLAIFTASLITPLRIRIFTHWTRGLARQLRLHHTLAQLAALLIICHIGWELYSAPWPGAQSLIISDDPALMVAWIAVFAFMGALACSYATTLRYRKWYSLHMLFPFSYILALFHAYQFRLIEPFDETAVFALGATGILALMSMVVHKYWNPTVAVFLVKELRKLSLSSWELVLRSKHPKSVVQQFRAGDVVYLRFLREGFTRSLHPFSVASCRFEPELRLYIKSLGHDTSHLQDLNIDSEIQLIGPYWELRPDPSRPQVWVAGGIGISPFIGFIHCMGFEKWPHPVHLIHYSSSDKEKSVELDSLWKQSGSLNHLKITNAMTPGENLDFSSLDIAILELEDPLILVCGPPLFMRAIRKHLTQLGIAKRNIKTEEFVL